MDMFECCIIMQAFTLTSSNYISVRISTKLASEFLILKTMPTVMFQTQLWAVKIIFVSDAYIKCYINVNGPDFTRNIL